MPDWDLTDGRFRCIPRPRNATNILRLISTEAVSFELNSEDTPEKISCCFCCLFHRHHPIPRSTLTHKISRRAKKNSLREKFSPRLNLEGSPEVLFAICVLRTDINVSTWRELSAARYIRSVCGKQNNDGRGRNSIRNYGICGTMRPRIK